MHHVLISSKWRTLPSLTPPLPSLASQTQSDLKEIDLFLTKGERESVWGEQRDAKGTQKGVQLNVLSWSLESRRRVVSSVPSGFASPSLLDSSPRNGGARPPPSLPRGTSAIGKQSLELSQTTRGSGGSLAHLSEIRLDSQCEGRRISSQS